MAMAGKSRGKGDAAVAAVTYAAVTGFVLSILYPLFNIASLSLSSYATYIKNPMMFFPTELDFSAYGIVFGSKLLLSSYKNTVIITALGTGLTLFMTVIYAYPLSRPQVRFKPFFSTAIVITMLFSGGIIPSFLLMRGLGLLNTYAAQYLPTVLGAYNCILMVNFFKAMPEELIEAAMMDGASEPYILTRIVLPLSRPILATIVLFAAVGLWNQYFSAVIYVRDQAKWPVQLVLREILLASSTEALRSGGNLAELNAARRIPMEQLRYAALIVVMLPITCIYPFLQKYFASGVMLGAVKG
ncbi:MAG: carbohydrate ABC transporter permease [Clostridiales bacterium]|jgi:putative aldouronate transport system permease protein|nr:carbohydrate ABC transporter permease [Clostridiales bacterium]